jgi:hypothetical protein
MGKSSVNGFIRVHLQKHHGWIAVEKAPIMPNHLQCKIFRKVQLFPKDHAQVRLVGVAPGQARCQQKLTASTIIDRKGQREERGLSG